MHIDESTARPHPTANADVRVWDTQYCPASRAFSVFREAVCTTFMPWSLEFKSDQHFDGRVESFSMEAGVLARVQMTPLVAARSKLDIANSPLDCFYAAFILSGELNVEQCGRSNAAKSGDLVVYDGSRPVTVTERGGTRYRDLAFLIPKDRFNMIRNAEVQFNNALFTREQMINPLSNCLTFLAENMLSLSKDELVSLFDACVSLLPVAGGCIDDKKWDNAFEAQPNYLLREILHFVNRNIADANLSPQQAAKYAGVSVRYVHKLFAASGITFSSYVVAKRLDHVRRDLLATTCRHQPIFIVAYRWGFKDLSTFIRAFKKRFGCSPSHFRSKP